MMKSGTSLRLAAFGTVAVAAFVLPAAIVQAHGFMSDPPSRSALCAQKCVTECGAVQYEPQGVEGPKGFPAAGPPDGAICSAGLTSFSVLDDRTRAWPATRVSAGARNVTWTFTAPHATAGYRYFITNNGADVRRSNLTEIGSFPANGQRPGFSLSHTLQLPPRSGRQVLLAVWDIADTGNAFYSCIDVAY